MNGTIVKKQKHLLQISGLDLQNDFILTIPQGGCFSEITVDVKVHIVDEYLSKYIPKLIK